jgi:hypothetical protein
MHNASHDAAGRLTRHALTANTNTNASANAPPPMDGIVSLYSLVDWSVDEINKTRAVASAREESDRLIQHDHHHHHSWHSWHHDAASSLFLDKSIIGIHLVGIAVALPSTRRSLAMNESRQQKS